MSTVTLKNRSLNDLQRAKIKAQTIILDNYLLENNLTYFKQTFKMIVDNDNIVIQNLNIEIDLLVISILQNWLECIFARTGVLTKTSEHYFRIYYNLEGQYYYANIHSANVYLYMNTL